MNIVDITKRSGTEITLKTDINDVTDTNDVTGINGINDITAAIQSIPDLALYLSQTERELKHYYEPATGLFLAESPKVITRALDAGYEPMSMLLEQGKTTGEHAQVLDRIGDIPVYLAPHEMLATLTGYELTSGMQCIMRRKPIADPADICAGARRIAVLEDVMNPTNIGAIFRSAAAMGIDAVLLTRGCADPLYKRAARVSMGTVFQIPWTYLDIVRGETREVDITTKATANAQSYAEKVDITTTDASGNAQSYTKKVDITITNASANTQSYADTVDITREMQPSSPSTLTITTILHDLGFRTVALALDDTARPIYDEQLNAEPKLAIILGTEGDGLAPSTIATSDYKAIIPMYHQVDSLNVAAASAVAFYQLCQR